MVGNITLDIRDGVLHCEPVAWVESIACSQCCHPAINLFSSLAIHFQFGVRKAESNSPLPERAQQRRTLCACDMPERYVSPQSREWPSGWHNRLCAAHVRRNRKTGFKCPRGCGKLSTHEPCPGKVCGSHVGAAWCSYPMSPTS